MILMYRMHIMCTCTSRNWPKCNHFICDYMQLLVISNYIWTFLQLFVCNKICMSFSNTTFFYKNFTKIFYNLIKWKISFSRKNSVFQNQKLKLKNIVVLLKSKHYLVFFTIKWHLLQNSLQGNFLTIFFFGFFFLLSK